MNIEELINKTWPDWVAEQRIGRGANGTVYKVRRKDDGIDFYSAVKVISIPDDSSEAENLRYEGYDEEQTKSYFEEIVNNVISEVKLLASLRGAQNVVRIEDYKVIEYPEKQSWDILIRMEMLTPLNEFLCDKKLSEEEVIRLGCNLCDALSLCHQNSIIHRDIKPENIFVNEFGDFKIGDFGIAKQMECLSYSMSQKGTYGYVAPEVLTGNTYDKTVDIYSLGIVLYKILNNNRLPFLDPDKQLLSASERRMATERRLKGETILPIEGVSAALSDAILKACEFDPVKRFESAEQFKEALQNKNFSYSSGESTVVSSVLGNSDVAAEDNTRQPGKNKKMVIIICAAAVLCLLISVGAVLYLVHMNNKKIVDEESQSEDDETVNPDNLEDNREDKESEDKESEDNDQNQNHDQDYSFYMGQLHLLNGDYDGAATYFKDVLFDTDYFCNRSWDWYERDDVIVPDGNDTEAARTLVYAWHRKNTLDSPVTEEIYISWYWVDEDDRVDYIDVFIEYETDSGWYELGEWLFDSDLNVVESAFPADYRVDQWIYTYIEEQLQ